MSKLIFDDITRRCIGSIDGDGVDYNGSGVCIGTASLRKDLDLGNLSSLFLNIDGVTVMYDDAARLLQAKAARRLRIKAEARSLIEALDWKLCRAREREEGGWGTLVEIDVVLAEREAIRRSSDAAEAALDALTEAASVQAFTWCVDVAVAEVLA